MPAKLKTMQGTAVKVLNYIKAHLSHLSKSHIFNAVSVEWVAHMNNCNYILITEKYKGYSESIIW
jgi:hypothetical protein